MYFYVKLSMDGDMAFSYDGPLKAEVECIADLRRSYTDEDSLIEDLTGTAKTFQSSDIDFDKLYL